MNDRFTTDAQNTQLDLLENELHSLEVDTFEIEDIADVEQNALSGTCSSSSSSSCSSTSKAN
jgi:thiazolylpeptide-type bacteriocin precursor